MAGFVMPRLFYGTFEGALKGLVIHDGDARHRSVDRSNACCAKPRTTARGMPGARILPLKGVGKRNAAAALGLVLQPPCPCTRQLLAQAAPSSRVTSRPDP